MDDTVEVNCPYCGEDVTISIDITGGRRQSYVEDCAVCCRPWQVTVTIVSGTPHVELATSE